MPSGSGTNVGLRLLTVGAIALAVLIAGFLLLRGGGGGYRVSMTLDNANQLVRGNQVKVGGVSVGSVTKIALADDGRARIELKLDDDVAPLYRGTQASVRSASLSGIANRYVALQPGPDDDPEIEDGGSIPARASMGRSTSTRC